jgi:hypothetical protein
MAGSVGIGGLSIGVSLLVVFSMAIQTIGYQMESSLDTLETAAEPVPSFDVESSNMWPFALHDVTVAAGDGGSGYVNGTLTASVSSVPCEGFSGNFSVDGSGAINFVVITSPGNCASATPTIGFGIPAQTPTTAATFTLEMKTYVFANLTNTGQVTLPTKEVWLFVDGGLAQSLEDSNPQGLTSNNWYSGETLDLFWERPSATLSRLAFTYDGVTVGTTL